MNQLDNNLINEADTTSNKIFRLSEAVSNRIAAGEVIQRPANAIKELLENALDAGSSQIQVKVSEGGMKLLQIQDNGCGIEKDDLYLACERFATSKLSRFNDLETITTYGFRGEALASISHIAKVTIVSKTKNSNCAYKGTYLDGKLVPLRPGGLAEPQPCAGNPGTTIIVEELFYNVPMRKKVLRSAFDEYQMILDIVNRYSVHNKNISLSCKKQASPHPDLQISSNSTTKDKITQIYGRDIGSDLIEFLYENPTLKLEVEGQITQMNFRGKRMTMLLFINNRSVMCNSLKKAIDLVYSPLLLKGTHPFIYISIKLPSSLVDANIHPTKKEVHFLHEDEIIASISEAIQKKLESMGSSRVFQTNVLGNLAGATLIKPIRPQDLGVDRDLENQAPKSQSDPKQMSPEDKSQNILSFGQENNSRDILNESRTSVMENSVNTSFTSLNNSFSTMNSSTASIKRRDNKLIRTDNMERTLDGFYSKIPSSTRNNKENTKLAIDKVNSVTTHKSTTLKVGGFKPKSSKKRPRVRVNLESIKEIITEFQTASDDGLKELLTKHSFVGCINPKFAAIQSGTGLYMVDFCEMSEIMFKQKIITDFCNLPTFTIDPPLSIYKVSQMALSSNLKLPKLLPELDSQPDQAFALTEYLKEKSDMLEEYFSISIDANGNLTKMPSIVPNYIPTINKFPAFLIGLGSSVDWYDEKNCFLTLSCELAKLYRFEPPRNFDTNSQDLQNFFSSVQHHLFPYFSKASFHPPSIWTSAQENTSGISVINPLADLPDLYRVFERC